LPKLDVCERWRTVDVADEEGGRRLDLQVSTYSETQKSSKSREYANCFESLAINTTHIFFGTRPSKPPGAGYHH
jgi:hypothetical protein